MESGPQAKIFRKRYSQRFRSAWLFDDRYKNWLQRIEGTDTKCMCRLCRTILTAKTYDIEKHRKTEKHKKAELVLSMYPEQHAVISFEDVTPPFKTEYHYQYPSSISITSNSTTTGLRPAAGEVLSFIVF